jgi:hypothetical protein
LSSIPFIGEPCPTNRTGIKKFWKGNESVRFLKALNVLIPLMMKIGLMIFLRN